MNTFIHFVASIGIATLILLAGSLVAWVVDTVHQMCDVHEMVLSERARCLEIVREDDDVSPETLNRISSGSSGVGIW